MKPGAFFLILSFAVLLLSTCKKSSTTNPSGGGTVEGNVTLTITIMHHSWNVPSMPVYLKFNTTQWPGKDSTKYDIMKTANLQGIVTFDHIGPGNIVVYASGFDPIWNGWTIGDNNVSITKTDANSTVNDIVIVSEKF